ncbi:MAG: hypothetical protein K2M04_07560 [Muribaculaceae bacterium]|nr:hypothetical protein [Muribaculaceae bacterium]
MFLKKKRISYQLRLFVPVVILTWGAIFAIAFYQYNREVELRKLAVRHDIEVINARVLHAYEHPNDNAGPFLDFVADYFNDKTALDDIFISIYSIPTGELLDTIGAPLPPQPDQMRGFIRPVDFTDAADSPKMADVDPHRSFYYSSRYSKDRDVLVITALPYNVTLVDSLKVGYGFWVVVIIIMVVATSIIFFTTRHLSRNISTLRDFANRASRDGSEMDPIETEFSNDELGDISRQIVEIYNTRQNAIRAHEREHRIALNAVREKAQLKRQMSNNISHELKTPIGIVKGYVDTMIDNPDMDEQARLNFLHKAQNHVQRMVNMLDDLSTITRLEEVDGVINTERLDMHDLVYSLANEIEDSQIANGFDLVIDIPENCTVRGNETLISAALMNLVKNSVAYSNGNCIGIEHVSTNDRFATFTFWDNGDGVSDEHIGHLFERFYRVDKGRSRKNGGTGLGLPIVKSTFNNLGGSILVKHHQGGGLEFQFTIPVWKEGRDQPSKRK